MKLKRTLRAGLAIAACAGVVAPSGLAAGPTATYPTPLGLKADGLRWHAIARAYQLSGRSANTPTPQGLKADGLRWQALAKEYRQNMAANVRETAAVEDPPQIRADIIRARTLDKLYGNAWTNVTPAEFRRLVTAFGPEITTTMSTQQARAELARGQGLNQLAKRYANATTPPAPVASSSGFDWLDAGLGVMVAFGVMLLVVAGAIAFRKRRRPPLTHEATPAMPREVVQSSHHS